MRHGNCEKGIQLQYGVLRVGHTSAGAGSDNSTDTFNPSLQATVALICCFVNAGFCRIDLVQSSVCGGRKVRHHNVGATPKPYFPSLRDIHGSQGGGTGNIGLWTDKPRQGDHFVHH